MPSSERALTIGKTAYTWLVAVLDDRLFPAVVRFATHPFIILLTILLLVPLIFAATNTVLVLILGNYTNVVSASVSSIVLATSLKHHHAHKQAIATLQASHDAQGKQIAALHHLLTSGASAPSQTHETVAVLASGTNDAIVATPPAPPRTPRARTVSKKVTIHT